MSDTSRLKATIQNKPIDSIKSFDSYAIRTLYHSNSSQLECIIIQFPCDKNAISFDSNATRQLMCTRITRFIS